MAGNLKQRLIKAGRDFNYAEGVKVLANTDIKKDQVVYVAGSSGPFLKVDLADADAAGRSDGRMLIAKHDIPSGKYGVCLPWKLVTTKDTSAGSIGAPVYLADTPGSSVASNLTLTAPTGDAAQVVVGRVTIAATIANGGAMLVCPSAPERRSEGGIISGDPSAKVTGRAGETIVWQPGAVTSATLTMLHPVTITRVQYVASGTTSDVNLYKGASGTVSIVDQVTMGSTASVVKEGTKLFMAAAAIPAGEVIRIVKSGAGGSDTVIIDMIPSGTYP